MINIFICLMSKKGQRATTKLMNFGKKQSDMLTVFIVNGT